MPNTSPGLDTIFSEAIEITDEGARSSYLERVCGSNVALRHRVETLISAHLEAGRFLENPMTGIEASESFSGTTGFSAEDDTGAVLGHYTLLEKIGEGGMGAVYVAEQTHPVKRRVALKLIRPGMDSKEVVARFNAERQALALMDHPNIARVLDAGTADTGRPYFVMELVRGLPITEYCDQAKLPAAQRLVLFIQICRAVQHAHQKGVIHRDIKPTNVMVTLHDGVPVPKVIDFGIAKAVNQPLTDGLVYTRLTQLVGTPMYMSPEQAELSGLDIDTRSDVYSLGVLLYELLTGTTPFDEATLKNVGFDEMRRMIREDEPPRPSQRISTLDATARSTVSSSRGLDDRQLSRLLTGDLDLIVMKSLEKDRNRRYESAGALAADIERYLADQPIVARPPTVGYRFRKFTQRNRTALATAAILTFAFLAVGGSLVWGFWDRTARRHAAEQAATDALAASADHYRANRPDAALAEATRAVDTLTPVPGAERLLGDARQQVADLEIATRLEDAWLSVMETSFKGVDATQTAHAIFRDYRLDPTELSESEFVERVRLKLTINELVAGLDWWAANLRSQNGSADPLAIKLRAISDAADPDTWSRQVRNVTIDGTVEQMVKLAAEIPVESVPQGAITRIANALTKAGRIPEAEALLRRAAYARPDQVHYPFTLGDLLRWSSAEPIRMEALGYYRIALALRPRNLEIKNRIGTCLADHLGRPAEAVDVLREIIALRPDYIIARLNLVVALRKHGKKDEALAVAREAIAIAPNASTYQVLEVALQDVGRKVEAEEAYQAALRFEPKTVYDYISRGNMLSRYGRNDEAITAFREAVRRSPELVIARHLLGRSLETAGRADEALAAYRENLRFRSDFGRSRISLATILKQRGKVEEAVAEYRAAIRGEPNNPGYHLDFGLELHQMGRWDDAAAEFREAIRLKPDYFEAHFSLGRVLSNANRTEEAIDAYKEAIRRKPNFAEAHCNLASILRRRGQFADALEAFRRGHEYGSKDPKWPYPSAQWIEETQRLVVLAPRLPNIIAGSDVLTDPADLVLAAQVAANDMQFARSAELYQSAYSIAPALAEDTNGSRYSAACHAVQAGTGQGRDAHKVNAAGQVAWRNQALIWLRAELAFREKRLATGDLASRRMMQNDLINWQTDSDLLPVHDADSLAKLPDGERAEWTKFWADVQAVLDKSRGASVKPK